MNEKFSLGLNNKYQRPIIALRDWNSINALLDTGATFPVWTAEEDILKAFGGKLIAENISFGGFGGQTEGNLYKLHDVRIGKLIFPEFVVVSSKNLGDVPFHIILSATVFSGLIYTIDDKDHRLIIELPEGETAVRKLKIQDSNGILHVLYQSDTKGEK